MRRYAVTFTDNEEASFNAASEPPEQGLWRVRTIEADAPAWINLDHVYQIIDEGAAE